MMDIFHSKIIVPYVHNFIWNNLSKFFFFFFSIIMMFHHDETPHECIFGTEIFKFLKMFYIISIYKQIEIITSF